MADSPRRTWPTSPEDLADIHLCPGCFTKITLPVCPVCGFALTDPRALVVLDLGRTMLAAESDRQRVIQEVRRAQAAADVAAYAASLAASDSAAEPVPVAVPLAAAVPVAVPASVPVPVPVPEPEPEPETPWELLPEPEIRSEPVAAPVPPQAPREPRPPRPRLSVPVLLLIVGVSLVGVAAIFFMVYAWFTWGVAVRALIIGGITVATIAIASVLRRRALTATAEGIAVLGVVLLALDAWAVRANDFFGTAQVQPAVYAGVSILAVGVLCRVWARLSQLRSPDLAAVIALPAGLGLLVGGASSLPAGEAIVAGLLGASVGGLAQALPAPWSAARARTDAVPERITLAVIGVAALAGSAIVAAYTSLESTSLESTALPLWSGAAIILLGIAHAFLLRPRGGEAALPTAPVLAGIAASVAAAVATLIGWQLAFRNDLPLFVLLIAPVVAVTVPVLLDRVYTRVRTIDAARVTAAPNTAAPNTVAPITAALTTATALGALSLVATVVVWGVRAQPAISSGWISWQTDAATAPTDQAEGAVFAAIAGLLIAALLFVAPTLGQPVLRNVRLVAASVLVLAGVTVVAVPALLVGTATLVAVGGIIAMTRPTSRAGAAGAAAVAALTAYVAGTTAPWLWLIGIAVALAVPIAAHIIVRPTGSSAAWLTLAPVVVATISAFLAPAALSAVVGAPAEPVTAFVLIQWVALACVLGCVALRMDSVSRSTLAVSGYALFVLSLAPFASPSLGASSGLTELVDGSPAILGDPALAIVRCAALLVLVALIALGRTRVAAAASLGAAVLVAPVASATTFAVLQTLGLEQHGARALATTGAAVTVVWVAAVWSIMRPQPLHTRLIVDLGALASVLVLAWDVSADLGWAMLMVIAVGFTGASISRSWAALASDHTIGVPSTRSAGATTASAPRRLLVWPAFAFATVALWVGLSTSATASSLTIEAYAIPPAVGLLAFAVLLVWLRRHEEAAVAISASFALGLAAPAIAGWFGSPIRGTIVALVSAALVLLLTWTPALRARIPALAGATTGLVALGLVAVNRAWDEPPAQAAWLLLLIGVAYASAVGATLRWRSTGGRSWYAVIIPPLAVATAVAGGMPAAEHTPVLATALIVLAALHLAAAAIDKAPFGAATRWSTLAGAVAFATVGFLGGAATIDGVPIIELVSIPVAAIVLGGSALAQWRRHRQGLPASEAERAVWLGGLVIAVLPSVIAPIEVLRTWLAVAIPLVAALAAVLAPPAAAARLLRTASAVVLTAGALAMGARALAQASFDSAEFAVTAAGAGAIVVAVALLSTSAARSQTRTATALAAAGSALLVALIIVVSDGELVRTTVTATVAAVVAVGGAALLGLARWRGLGAVLAIAGFVAAVVAIGARLIIINNTANTSIEPDLWAVIVLGITAAVGIMALRSTAASSIASTVATVVGVAFSVALLLFTVAELVLLAYPDGDEARTVFTMTALSIAGFGGVLWRPRLGLTPPITAAVAAAIFGLVALLLYSVAPLELVTVPPALALVALGARMLHLNPQARTWPALGPGLALLTVPSLVRDFGETDLWRVVALGVVALVLVVVGAVWRLQAPLVLGSVVLLIHGVAQLWPWISTAYEYVPWWLWLGIGGALLIFLAARYEKNMRALRTSFTAVTSLR